MYRKLLLTPFIACPMFVYSSTDTLHNSAEPNSLTSFGYSTNENASVAQPNGIVSIAVGTWSVKIMDTIGSVFTDKGKSILSSWIFGGEDQPPQGLTSEDISKIRDIVRGEVGDLLNEQQYTELKENIRFLGERLDDYKWSTWDGGYDHWTLENANEYSDYVISDSVFLPEANGGHYWHAAEELMLAISLRITVKTEMVYRDLRPEDMVKSEASQMLEMLRDMHNAVYYHFRHNHTIECYEIMRRKHICEIKNMRVAFQPHPDEYSAYNEAYQYREQKLYEFFGGYNNYQDFVQSLQTIING